jgi:ferric-dicitrate binding protein FerR (iron transport regulator)
MENQESIHQLILRLFSGEANNYEKKKIAEWLGLSDGNKKFYSELRENWLSGGIQRNDDQYDVENAIQNFRDIIGISENRNKRKIVFLQFVKYAAVFILALALPFSYNFLAKNIEPHPMTTISCAFGDKSNIVLPDSTKVWLNSGSKLTFDSDFKRNGRRVLLEGEAFFSVSKDKDNPFHVKTSDVDIKVLGTQFNVKAYPDEISVSTTLVEGSLRISSSNENRVIKPDEKLIFDKRSGTMTLNKLTDTSPDIDWKKGRLIFRNESLEELEPKLERWFDVDIVFADEQVKHRRFTGILERESILEVISYFDLSKYVECRIQGNKIIIKTKIK